MVLSGIRVLDFGHFIAGPFCAALLADYGADVIRIERPQGGADRYVQALGKEDKSAGGFYLQANRNKRALTLDVFCAEGRAITQKLIAGADVVIANLPHKTLTAMGLDYESVSAIKADIILSTCNAYGAQGPGRDRPGFDGIGQALSGAMHMSGEGGVPRKAYAHYVDFATAALSAFGVMLALWQRQASGRGQAVTSSLLGTALAMMNAPLMEQHLHRPDRQGSGNLAQLAGPADVYRSRDGWVLLQVLGDSMFRRWTQVVGRPQLVADPRFANDRLRGEHGALLSTWMSEWCAVRSTQACLDALRAAGLPAAPVYTFQQVLDDPEIAAGRFWDMQGFPGICAPYPLARAPVSLSSTPPAAARRAPTLGEHTDDILQQLGYAPADIKALRSQGIV